MVVVFEALLPVFLLILAGMTLKKMTLIPDEHWSSLERISYYVLLAPLLVLSFYRSDFSQLSFGAIVITFVISLSILLLFGIVLRKPVLHILGTNDPAYSSMYQGFTRWNAFIALAIVEKLYGIEALTVVFIAMATMVLPLNVANVAVVAWLGKKEASQASIASQFIKNPIILGCLVGLGLKLTGLPIYSPLEDTMELLSRATLPVGLLLVGAGLQWRMPKSSIGGAIFSACVRLMVAPALYFALGSTLGVSDQDLIIVTLCGGVPTAMSGYLLAKQLGGDAPLMAAIMTIQVFLSFVTLPIVILAAQFMAQ